MKKPDFRTASVAEIKAYYESWRKAELEPLIGPPGKSDEYLEKLRAKGNRILEKLKINNIIEERRCYTKPGVDNVIEKVKLVLISKGKENG